MTSEATQSKIAFYIFKQDESGDSQRAGTAYRHAKGSGINIVIGKDRYVAFPPKTKTEEEEGA